MQLKRFHLWEFPEDKIRVLLKNQRQFLLDASKFFGSYKELANFIETSTQRIHSWEKLYLPLWALKRIVNSMNLNWGKIEKDVISYKSISNGKPIKNPILPVEESPKLYSLITHLICDGCVNKNGIPFYINTEINLINNFKKSLKKCFGNVHTRVRKNNEKQTYEFSFSKSITDIISYLYNIKFDSFDGNLPKNTYKLPNKFTREIIGACVDDEGTIKDGRVIISMKNKKFLKEIRLLIIKLFGLASVSRLNLRKSEKSWNIAVNAPFLSRFQEKINVIHPTKRKDLKYFVRKIKIKKVGKGELPWKTKLNILKNLNIKRMNAKQIGKQLFINPSNINIHLNKLYEIGLIKKLNMNKHSLEWYITKRGKKFLEYLPYKNKEDINTNLIKR